jgi:FtsH-binding integral membrane protein
MKKLFEVLDVTLIILSVGCLVMAIVSIVKGQVVVACVMVGCLLVNCYWIYKDFKYRG